MSSPSPTTADAKPIPASLFVTRESWTALAAWACDELGLRLAFDGDRYELRREAHEPAPPSPAAGGQRSWLRRRRADSDAENAAAEFAADKEVDVVRELANRLNARDEPAYVKPTGQPEAVHEITDRLFAAYELGEGKVHVAGCLLEDLPLVRLTKIEDGPDDKPTLRHAYFDAEGRPLDGSLIANLGLDETAPAPAPPRAHPAGLLTVIEAARVAAGGDDTLATIVLAKYASGQLRFEFGEESVDTPFSGWARTLAAPPVICPETGRATHHLTTTHDGLIAAAEEVAVCEASGRRCLRSELATCAATGKLVSKELVGRCEASGETMLLEHLTACPVCGSRVAQTAVSVRGCRVCRSLRRVPADEPRVATLMAAHPGLAGWGGWRAGDTSGTTVFEAARGWTRLLLVADKDSADITRAATSPRFLARWRRLDADQQRRLLS